MQMIASCNKYDDGIDDYDDDFDDDHDDDSLICDHPTWLGLMIMVETQLNM